MLSTLSRPATTLSRRSLSTLLSLNEEFPGVPSTTPSPKTSTSPTLTILPSGLTVITEPNSATTTVQMTYPSGSASEQAGEAGAALAAKHMAFKSSSTSSSARILYDLELSGATPFSSVTRFSSTSGYTCSPDHAVDLLATLSTPSSFELWDMRDARAYAALDKETMFSTPETCLSDLIYAASYGEKTSAGKSMYQTVSNEGIASFIGRELCGGTLVATGVEDHKAFVDAASQAFVNATGGTPSEAQAFTGGEARLSAVTPYSHISLSVASSGSNAVDAVVAALLSQSTPTGSAGFTAPGIVGVYGSALAEDAGKLTENLRAAISSGGDIEAAKSRAKADAVFTMESSSSALASTLSSNCGMSAGDIAKGIEGVKSEDVKKALAGKIAMAAVGDLKNVPYVNQI